MEGKPRLSLLWPLGVNWQEDKNRNVCGASWDSKGREPDTLCILSCLPYPLVGCASAAGEAIQPLWGCGSSLIHPRKPLGILWDAGQQTERGRDASLSLPSAVVYFLLPHWEVLMISNTIRQGASLHFPSVTTKPYLLCSPSVAPAPGYG